METSPELFDYGIHNEATDIRAHVGVIARRCYVFPTRSGISVMKLFPEKLAMQPGWDAVTAKGHIVPWERIPNLLRVNLNPEWLHGFTKELSTSEKGIRAVAIVAKLLRAGRFPLWFDGELIGNVHLQIEGEDIRVQGKWRIQVKCDFNCGEKEFGGTGNLFLQTAERNPLHRV